MREIKFRAWDIERKGYIQGFNMVNYHGYFNKDLKKSIYRYDTGWDEGEYILEQYTGFKDKNNKEIHEGDIDKVFGEIIMVYGCFIGRVFVLNEEDEEDKKDTLLGNTSQNQREIIGNIHENPELLKER